MTDQLIISREGFWAAARGVQGIPSAALRSVSRREACAANYTPLLPHRSSSTLARTAPPSPGRRQRPARRRACTCWLRSGVARP